MWSALCGLLLGLWLFWQRLASVRAIARNDFDNPLMQLIYIGRVDSLAEIELAMRMRRAGASCRGGSDHRDHSEHPGIGRTGCA